MATYHSNWKRDDNNGIDKEVYWSVFTKYKNIAAAISEAGRMIEVGNAKGVETWVNKRVDESIRFDVIAALNEIGFNIALEGEVNAAVDNYTPEGWTEADEQEDIDNA